MGTKDVTEKLLEDYADVFADIVNVLLFEGERRIDPKDVRQAQPRSIYKASGKILEQERDVAKYWTVDGVNIALVGIENQTCFDEYMPLRVASYDGASYRKALSDRDSAMRENAKLRKKKRRAGQAQRRIPVPPIYPVVTIVLYFGMKPWKGSKSLLDCVKVPDHMKPYVSDYKINVFEVAWLDEGTVAKFQSDFRYVAELMVAARKAKDGVGIEKPSGPIEIKHAQETLALLEAMTGDDRFREACGSLAKGGKPDMFALFDVYEKRGIRKGIKRGVREGVKKGIKRGATNVASLVRRIRHGEDREQLIASGADPELVDMAFDCLRD